MTPETAKFLSPVGELIDHQAKHLRIADDRLALAQGDLEGRPTPEVWAISCRLIDAAIDKIRAALEGQTHFDDVRGLKNLVDALIADRDGWKQGSQYWKAEAERNAANSDSTAAEWRKAKEDLQRLRDAASALYPVQWWTHGITPVAANKLWANLRDALGITPGTATAAGVGGLGTASGNAVLAERLAKAAADEPGVFRAFDPATGAGIMFRRIGPDSAITPADRADFMLREDVDVVTARKSSSWNWHVYRNGSILASALTKADCVDAAIKAERSEAASKR